VGRYDSLLYDAAARFDSLLHDAAARFDSQRIMQQRDLTRRCMMQWENFNSNNSTNSKQI
jgi:16S rRNA C1402 (ribose-2'-O) methylase RsmI